MTGLLPFLPASAFIPHTDCKTTLLLAKSRVRLTESLLWLPPPSHWLHTPGESLDLWPFLDMETCSSRGRGQDHHSHKQSGGPWGDPEQLRGVCCVGWGGGSRERHGSLLGFGAALADAWVGSLGSDPVREVTKSRRPGTEQLTSQLSFHTV